MENELSTEDRLKNAIKHQPDRYIVVKDSNDKMIEVHDKDNGYMWIKFEKDGKEYWGWIS